MPGPSHGHGVEHVEQHVGPQVVGILPRGLAESLLQRADSTLGENGVVPDEQGQQIVQVPQRVVHGRGRHQHQLLGRLSQEQPPQRLGAPRVGIAEHMGLIHHHHRVVVGTVAEVLPFAAQLPVVEEFLEGNVLKVKLVVVGESFPHPVAQRGRRDQEHPLPPVLHRLPDQLAGNEGLAQAHAIGEQHAVVLAQDSPGAPQAVALERGQPDDRVAGLLLLQFPPIQLPKDTQVDQVGRILLVSLRVDRRQVERLGLFPKVVEPLLHLPHGRGVVAAEVQFQVAGQSGGREVARPGDNPLVVGEDERLAVQEPLLVAADFDRARFQQRQQPANGGLRRRGELQQVPVPQQPGIVGADGFMDHAGIEPGERFADLAGRPGRWRRRLGTQQQPHLGQAFEAVGQQPEPFRVEVAAGDGKFDGPRVGLGQPVQMAAQRRHQRVAVAIIDELGFHDLPHFLRFLPFLPVGLLGSAGFFASIAFNDSFIAFSITSRAKGDLESTRRICSS